MGFHKSAEFRISYSKQYGLVLCTRTGEIAAEPILDVT